jgi:HK97 family phage portal protein
VSWLQKAVSTLSNWLVVGPDPKIRDPQNSSRGGDSTAGVAVTDQTAMTLSAFWACLMLKGGTVGGMSIGVFDGYGEKTHRAVTNVPLFGILHESPNADQTPTDYWEFATISLMLRGNHYARKLKEGGRLIGLEPVRPDIVSVRRREDGRIGYRWSWEGRSYDLTEDDVFHIRGFGGGPLGGLSTIAYARESLGLAIAAERTAGGLFANGVRPTGALTFKEFLSPDDRTIARGDMVDQFAGAANAGRPFILEGGATWSSISMNADDAQLLESRAWSVEDVCRWCMTPPVMIGHTSKTTSWPTGTEQQVLLYLKFGLNTMLRRIEQSIRKQLLTPAERARGLFAEFNMETLLRGDSAGRARFYQVMTLIGAMTRNEVRSKENLPPIDGGDVVTIQSQNVPLEQLIQQSVEDGLQKLLPDYLARMRAD